DMLVDKMQQPVHGMAEQGSVRERDAYQQKLQGNVRHKIVVVDKAVIHHVVAAIEIEVAYTRRAEGVGCPNGDALGHQTTSGQRGQGAAQAVARDVERALP